MLALVASGEAELVIGTHAVIQEQVQFSEARPGDHRRAASLRRRAAAGAARQDAASRAQEPHLLMMSATPIPRTLAMSYYADLDVSTIDELPPGRTPIVTKLIADSRRDEVIERIARRSREGRQVYWVCPLIEESEALRPDQRHRDPRGAQCRAAGRAWSGLVHARMPAAEKKARDGAFTGGRWACWSRRR